MSAPGTIEATARILSLHRQWVYLAEMPNGFRITAFVLPKHQKLFPEGLPLEALVKVQMTTHDFSTGQIIGFAESI